MWAGRRQAAPKTAEPPLIMRDTIHCLTKDAPDEAAIRASVEDMIAQVQKYVPGYRLVNGPVFDGTRVPIMDFPIRIDCDALTLGYAGVYGSFLLFAKRAEKKYGVPAREILVETGRRGMVGGQEDMIEDTALNLAKTRQAQGA